MKNCWVTHQVGWSDDNFVQTAVEGLPAQKGRPFPQSWCGLVTEASRPHERSRDPKSNPRCRAHPTRPFARADATEQEHVAVTAQPPYCRQWRRPFLPRIFRLPFVLYKNKSYKTQRPRIKWHGQSCRKEKKRSTNILSASAHTEQGALSRKRGVSQSTHVGHSQSEKICPAHQSVSPALKQICY